MPSAPGSSRLRHPAARLVLFLGLLLLGAALLAGALYVIRFPAQRSHGELRPWPLLATGVLACGLVGLISWLCLRLDHLSFGSIGLPKHPVARPFFFGLGLGGLAPAATMLCLTLSGHATTIPSIPQSHTFLVSTLPMVLATLLLSSWEELAFRGYALQQLVRWTGRWPAATLTGVLFGLAHTGNPGANALGFLNTAVNGVLLASIVLTSGSLWWACGYHAGWNLLASLGLGAIDSGTHAPGALAQTTLSGPTWLSGGSYGFEASALSGLVESLVLGLILLHARRIATGPVPSVASPPAAT